MKLGNLTSGAGASLVGGSFLKFQSGDYNFGIRFKDDMGMAKESFVKDDIGMVWGFWGSFKNDVRRVSPRCQLAKPAAVGGLYYTTQY